VSAMVVTQGIVAKCTLEQGVIKRTILQHLLV